MQVRKKGEDIQVKSGVGEGEKKSLACWPKRRVSRKLRNEEKKRKKDYGKSDALPLLQQRFVRARAPVLAEKGKERKLAYPIPTFPLSSFNLGAETSVTIGGVFKGKEERKEEKRGRDNNCREAPFPGRGRNPARSLAKRKKERSAIGAG